MRRKTPHPFGAVVARIIKEKGFTGYGIAKKLGKTPDQVRSVTRGDNSPRVDTIVKYAEVLEIEPWDLFKELILEMRKQEKNKARAEKRKAKKEEAEAGNKGNARLKAKPTSATKTKDKDKAKAKK